MAEGVPNAPLRALRQWAIEQADKHIALNAEGRTARVVTAATEYERYVLRGEAVGQERT